MSSELTIAPYHFNASRKLWTGYERVPITWDTLGGDEGGLSVSRVIKILAGCVFAFLEDLFQMAKDRFNGPQRIGPRPLATPLSEEERTKQVQMTSALVSYVSGRPAVIILSFLEDDTFRFFRLNPGDEARATIISRAEQSGSLNVAAIQRLNDFNAQCKAQGLSLVRTQKGAISTLDLRSSPMTDKQFQELVAQPEFADVSAFQLALCPNITDASVIALAQRFGDQLVAVGLHSNWRPMIHMEQEEAAQPLSPAITGASLAALADHCPNLQRLLLWHFRIPEPSVVELVKRCCQLSKLIYGTFASTNELYHELAQHRTLTDLTIHHSSPDANIEGGLREAFAKCPITRLHLHRVSLSVGAIQSLAEHRAAGLVEFTYMQRVGMAEDAFLAPAVRDALWDCLTQRCKKLEAVTVPRLWLWKEVKPLFASNPNIAKFSLWNVDERGRFHKVYSTLKECRKLQLLSFVLPLHFPFLAMCKEKYPDVIFSQGAWGYQADLPFYTEVLSFFDKDRENKPFEPYSLENLPLV